MSKKEAEEEVVEEAEKVQPVVVQESPSIGLLRALRESAEKGRIDPVTLYLLSKIEREEKRMQWEEEDRREERKRQQSPQITPEAIAAAIAKALENVLPKTQSTSEMPDWAKELQKQQQEILGRLSKQEQEERDKRLIAEAQAPLKAEIEKRDALIAQLQEEIKALKEKALAPPPPQKSPLEAAKEAVEFTDKIRPPQKPERRGKATDIDVALATVEKATDVIKDVGKGVQETIGQFIDWQIAKERKAYRQIAPKLPELTPEEKLKVLQQAAGEEAAKT